MCVLTALTTSSNDVAVRMKDKNVDNFKDSNVPQKKKKKSNVDPQSECLSKKKKYKQFTV